jgi:hypothetical protein
MHKHAYMRRLLHTALLLLVLSGVGHIHNHICLDGKEPAELVHFENLGGHPDHHEDDIHADVENELMPQVLLTKVPNQDSVLFLLTCSLLLCQHQPRQRQHYLTSDDHQNPRPPSELLPPLRAPPAHSS